MKKVGIITIIVVILGLFIYGVYGLWVDYNPIIHNDTSTVSESKNDAKAKEKPRPTEITNSMLPELTEKEIIDKINNGEVRVLEGEIVYDDEDTEEVENTEEVNESPIHEDSHNIDAEETIDVTEPDETIKGSETAIEECNEPIVETETVIEPEPIKETIVEPVIVEPVIDNTIFTDSLTDGTANNVIIDADVTDTQKIEFFKQYNMIPYPLRKDLMDMGQPIHLTTSSYMTGGSAGAAYAMQDCYIWVNKKNSIKIATIHEFGHLIDAIIANRTDYNQSGAFYSENSYFVNIYNKEKDQSGFPSYAKDCVEDYFAEAFMYYHQDRSKLDNVPETKQYIHDLILTWYGIEY